METESPNPFPDVTPIKSTPTLWRLNGIGTTLMGRRDVDEASGTYVKTQVFTILLVPVAALAAYRVADSEEGGWYFIGRGPLSSFARNFNLAAATLLGLLILGISWSAHSNSPEVRAGERFDRAEEIAAMQPDEAARELDAVAIEIPEMNDEAADRLRSLPFGSIEGAPTKSIIAAFKVVERYVADLAPLAARAHELSADREPADEFALLSLARDYDPNEPAIAARRTEALDELLAAHPKQLRWAQAKALDLAGQGDLAGAKLLLDPHRDKLKASKGAEIYGTILCATGDLENGIPILQQYVAPRMKRFRGAVAALRKILEARNEEAYAKLDRHAPYELEKAYEAAPTEAEKALVVQNWVDEQVHADPDVERAKRAYRDELGVIGPAMDLGIFIISDAQRLNGAEREARLAEAKEILVGIQGAASGSPTFNLALGKVQCWLGEMELGRELFDELLEADRSPQNLLGVASALRDVGLSFDAGDLAEEAFAAATEPELKRSAATLRALTARTAKEKVEWLEKVKDPSPMFQAQLASAHAQQADADGDEKAAAGHYRRAIELLAAEEESAATLNNGAVACFGLYGITRDRADFDRGSALIDRALELSPTDGIIMSNAAGAYLGAVAETVAGDRFDFALAQTTPYLGMLDYLYGDRAGRDRLATRILAHPGTAKARTMLDRARLLSPSNETNYSSITLIARLANEPEVIAKLADVLTASPPDMSTGARGFAGYVAGDDDESSKALLDGVIERGRAVLSAIEPKAHTSEYAFASMSLASMLLDRADITGASEDVADAVRVLESAYDVEPRHVARSLGDALIRRALSSASLKSEAIAKLRVDFERAMGSVALATYVARRPELGPTLFAEPEFTRAHQLLDEHRARFPDRGGVIEWALLGAADPASAAARAQAAQKNPFSDPSSRLNMLIGGYSPSVVYERYLLLTAREDVAGAAEVLANAAASGVRLPPIKP